MDRPFTVRAIVKSDEKIGGSLIDAEIGGTRTLMTFRSGLDVKKLLVRPEGVELTDLRLAPLEN